MRLNKHVISVLLPESISLKDNNFKNGTKKEDNFLNRRKKGLGQSAGIPILMVKQRN